MGDKHKLGEILCAAIGFPHEKIAEALQHQSERGGRIGEILVGMKLVDPSDVVHALGKQLDLQVIDEIDVSSVDTDLARKMVEIQPILKNWMKLQMQKRVLPTSLAALPCVAGLAPVQGT